MNAIPTKYAGVQFRSRLEARWAAFFDLLGFEWNYEPIDLAGYIPDFILCRRVLVEVKPLLWSSDPADIEVRDRARAKLIGANGGRFHWVALVGSVMPNDGSIGECAFSSVDEDAPWRWYPLTMGWWQDESEFSLLGQPMLRSSKWTTSPPPSGLWREAGNLTQWRGVGARL